MEMKCATVKAFSGKKSAQPAALLKFVDNRVLVHIHFEMMLRGQNKKIAHACYIKIVTLWMKTKEIAHSE